MADPTTLSFGDLVIEVENDGAPDTYTPRMCGMTNKGLDITANTSSAKVPPCDDPTAPAWNIKGVSSIDGSVSMNGVYAAEDSSFWNKWIDSGLAKNVRIREVGVGYRAGPALITSLGSTTQLDQDANLLQRPVKLDNAGAWPWTDGDPA